MELTKMTMKELVELKENIEKEYRARREETANNYVLKILALITAAEEEGFEVAINKDTWQNADDTTICISDPELDDD